MDHTFNPCTSLSRFDWGSGPCTSPRRIERDRDPSPGQRQLTDPIDSTPCIFAGAHNTVFWSPVGAVLTPLSLWNPLEPVHESLPLWSPLKSEISLEPMNWSLPFGLPWVVHGPLPLQTLLGSLSVSSLDMVQRLLRRCFVDCCYERCLPHPWEMVTRLVDA